MIPDEMHRRETATRGWTLVAMALAVVLVIAVAETALAGHPYAINLPRATNNWIDMTSVAVVGRMAGVGFILFGLGRFRLRDAGIRAERFFPGIAIVVGIWSLTQIGLATNDLVRDGMLRLNAAWRIDPLVTMAGWVRQFGGEALFEELFFRGFLLVWLTAELTRRFRHPIPGALFGMIVSQALFAVAHLPERVGAGAGWAQLPIDLVLLTLTGVYYGFLYLRTDNLFIAMGVHALASWPAPIFDTTSNAAKMTILVASAFLFVPTRSRASAAAPREGLAETDDTPLPPNPSPS